jgi:hypothetical protein
MPRFAVKISPLHQKLVPLKPDHQSSFAVWGVAEVYLAADRDEG